MSVGTCLLCFSINVKIYDVIDTHLQPVYEKITGYGIQNETYHLCFICRTRLQQCHDLVDLALLSQDPQEGNDTVQCKSSMQLSKIVNQNISILSDNVVVKNEPENEFVFYPEYSPIRAHADEEFTQCLQEITDDVFSNSDEPVNTLIPEQRIPPVEAITAETRVTEDTQTLFKGTSTIANSTPTPLPNPILFAASTIRSDENYLNLPAPSTISGTSTNVTSTTRKVSRKKTNKTDEGSKRLPHKERWCGNQSKKMKNEGRTYITKKGKEITEKVLGQPCGTKCRYMCTDNYDLQQREAIFSKFWSLGDRSKHWEFVIKYTEKNTKRCKRKQRTTLLNKHNREYTYVYYLPTAENELKRVCKQMFLSTISSGERIIPTAWKKYDGIGAVEEDKRGKYDHKPRVIDEEMIRSIKDHVNCLIRVDSHCARRYSKKLYLNNIKSISQMYKLYVKWFDPNNYAHQASERQYRNSVNANFNLAFHKPIHELCEACYIFANNQFPTEEEKRVLEHQERKKKARALKQADKTVACKNPEIVVAAFDFQKVMQSPHGEVNIFYYKRKLNIYNFTLFELANKTSTCYMWHEGIGKRGANEVSSCLYDFIKVNVENGIKEFRFWSDNRSGENRKRVVFALYLLVAKKFGVTITHRFMEKGHTRNEGDNLHEIIDKESNRKMIYTPDEWYCLMRWAKTEDNPYSVREMTSRDFYNIKDLLANRKWVDVRHEKINWTQIREVKVMANVFDRIQYKYDFDDDSKTLVLRPKRNTERINDFTISQAFEGPVPIPYGKYKDLNDMCKLGVIPERCHSFYTNLLHASSDVIEEGSDSE